MGNCIGVNGSVILRKTAIRVIIVAISLVSNAVLLVFGLIRCFTCYTNLSGVHRTEDAIQAVRPVVPRVSPADLVVLVALQG